MTACDSSTNLVQLNEKSDEHELDEVNVDRPRRPSKLRVAGMAAVATNAAATERVRRQSGAAVATLSRGPYCPPSTFFVFHRSQLQRLLASFRLWQRAWDARALTRDAKRLRWEYVACSMLAPGEGGLLLHYNHSDLEKGQ